MENPKNEDFYKSEKPDSSLACPAKVNPAKRVDIKLRGFKLTVSVKGDLSTESVEKITKWAKRSCDMHYIVVEKGENVRDHLHALLCMKNGYVKRNLCDYVYKNMVKPYNEGTVQKFAVRVDVLHDSVWYNEYLRKEQDVKVISTDYDVSHESDYYPTEEEQAFLQEFATGPHVVDDYYDKLATGYLEYVKLRPNPTIKDALEYLYDRMYVKREMRVISDERRCRQTALAMYWYAHKDKSFNFEDRKWFASQHGPTMDFNG